MHAVGDDFIVRVFVINHVGVPYKGAHDLGILQIVLSRVLKHEWQ